MSPRPLVLASSSPRRRELLALGGWEFDVCRIEMEEIPDAGESAADFVRRMSRAKARQAAEWAKPGAVVIGADTVVVLDGQILGKPRDLRHAVTILQSLRGRTHEVLTGLTLFDTAARDADSPPHRDVPVEQLDGEKIATPGDAPSGRLYTQWVRSHVLMRDYSDAEIQAYVATGDPLDKAGAYAVQDTGFRPVDRDRFGDCLANVMGLPLCHVLRGLRRLGLHPATDLPAACQEFVAYECPVFEMILREEV